MKKISIVLLVLAFIACNQTHKNNKEHENSGKMKIDKDLFGQIDDQEVYLFTLTNSNGMQVKITNYGGIITSILVPGKDGEMADVVLGFDSLKGYLDGHPYFGCIVGRYANRIADAKFTLNGKEYKLASNNGKNSLHGGNVGFDKRVWEPEVIETQDSISLKLSYLSKDMEEGYPGNLSVKVVYSLTGQNTLNICYEAETNKPTVVNLTNHSYFNLSGAGEGDILDHQLHIDANHYTPVDETLIPTGELRSVEGPMDFRTYKMIGEDFKKVDGGYDHNYVLNNDGKMQVVAGLYDEVSGRAMNIITTAPGLQFYSGNFLDGSIIGKANKPYYKNYGLCLETQAFPDSPNQENFTDVILNPGKKYHYCEKFHFYTK